MAYQVLTSVMASTANGTVVPSAYGDQFRDNQVAMNAGWSFSASGAVSQSMTGTAWTLVQMNALSLGSSSLTAFEASVTSGYVLLTCAGVWLIDAGYVGSSATVYANLSVGTAVGQTIYETNEQAQGTGITVSGVVVTTSTPTYVSLWCYATGGATLNGTVLPFISGVWKGTAS